MVCSRRKITALARLSPRAVKGRGADQAEQRSEADTIDSISGARAYDGKRRAEQSLADLKMDCRPALHCLHAEV
jgi:hypothetical protein